MKMAGEKNAGGVAKKSRRAPNKTSNQGRNLFEDAPLAVGLDGRASGACAGASLNVHPRRCR